MFIQETWFYTERYGIIRSTLFVMERQFFFQNTLFVLERQYVFQNTLVVKQRQPFMLLKLVRSIEPKGKFIPSYEQAFMVTQYIFLFGRNDNVPTENIVRAWNENISVFGERFLPHEFLSIPNKYNVHIFVVYLERQRTIYRKHCSCVAREQFRFFWNINQNSK